MIGIVTQNQVNQSKRGQADLDEEVEGEDDGGGTQENEEIELDLLFSLDDAVQESKQFSIQLDVNFEN